MGMLINGKWEDKDQRRAAADGSFIRPESPYREAIAKDSNQFAPEEDRYHLFVNAGCPWAYRTILYRSIKNLAPYLTISYTEPAAARR